MEEHSKTKHETSEKHHKKTASKNLKSFFQKLTKNLKPHHKKHSKAVLMASLNRTILACEHNSYISGEQNKMIHKILNIGDVKAGDIMTPRGDIVAIQNNVSLNDIKELALSNEHSRMPVFKDNLDEIIGFVHSKDLTKYIGSHHHEFKLSSLIRKVIFIPESMRIIDLLLKMRSSRIHIAIVLDEYGSTNGIVTIEDIVEEIVGEIEDEHDLPSNNIYLTLKKIDNHTILAGGRIEIKKIEELLDFTLSENNKEPEFDTVAGLTLSAFKKVPETGETAKYGKILSIKVLEADIRSVKLVEIRKHNHSSE